MNRNSLCLVECQSRNHAQNLLPWIRILIYHWAVIPTIECALLMEAKGELYYMLPIIRNTMEEMAEFVSGPYH